jgi:polysaccharide biosynthesis/export protein
MNLKKGKSWGAAVVLAIVLLSSCRSLKNTNTLFQSEYDKFADTAKSVYVANENQSATTDYKIRPFDVIAITNLQNPQGFINQPITEGAQIGALFRGNSKGEYNLPVVGIVELIGLTQNEAAMKLQDLYGKNLFKNPIITLSVVNNKVMLIGESSKPGNYQLERERIDLIELIGRSGGLTPQAEPKKIKIIRGDRKNPEIIYVNLKDVNSLASDKLILQNNDIVYIPPRGLYNATESIKSYSGVVQPAFLILNALVLIYSFRSR